MTEARPQINVLRPEAVVGGALQQRRTEELRTMVREQGWHVHAAQYDAAFMLPEEIAALCDVDVNSVYRLRKSVVHQERVNRILAERSRPVTELFEKAVVGAALRIIDLSQTAKSETIRLAANREICDRHLGKPVAVVQQETLVRSADPVMESAELDARIRALAGEASAARHNTEGETP